MTKALAKDALQQFRDDLRGVSVMNAARFIGEQETLQNLTQLMDLELSENWIFTLLFVFSS